MKAKQDSNPRPPVFLLFSDIVPDPEQPRERASRLRFCIIQLTHIIRMQLRIHDCRRPGMLSHLYVVLTLSSLSCKILSQLHFTSCSSQVCDGSCFLTLPSSLQSIDNDSNAHFSTKIPVFLGLPMQEYGWGREYVVALDRVVSLCKGRLQRPSLNSGNLPYVQTHTVVLL